MSGMRSWVNLLVGRAEHVQIEPTTALHWMLRVACSMCFIGHGAWGIITKAGWLPFYDVFGIPESPAWKTMPLIGLADVSLGIAVLFHPCRAILTWMAFWTVFTALLRPLAGMGWWEFLERGGNYGPPIAFLLLAQPQRLGWFDRVKPLVVPKEVLNRVRWTLQIAIALLFIGHGGFAAVQQKQVLLDHWASVGVPMEAQALRIMGLIEIIAGVMVLLINSRWYVLSLALWKVATELLYPLAGRGVDVWEWVERGGDYLGPYALLWALYLLSAPAARSAAAPVAPPLRRGFPYALRTLAASAAVTLAVAMLFIFTSVNFSQREAHFEEYGKLVEYGYQKAGWLPSDLPHSAADIREVHDLSTKAVLASFRIADRDDLERYATDLRARSTNGNGACAPSSDLAQAVSFWPAQLVPSAVEVLSANNRAAFGIDRATATVYFWTCP